MHEGHVRIYPGIEALTQAATRLFVQSAESSVASKGSFAVVLSGGTSPQSTYRLLARPPYVSRVPWNRTHVFWGDERCVPRNDIGNNARMAFDTLLNHVPIPGNQVHPIPSEDPPEQAANHYETALRQFFPDGTARFDLVFLGLGTNGHTASLFPDTLILEERQRWVREVYLAEENRHRVSLTAPAINQAALVAFLVHGSDKSQVLRAVLEGPRQPRKLPAQLIQPSDGELLWLVDEEAARDSRG
jgi:6-phosphogluconolactonase